MQITYHSNCCQHYIKAVRTTSVKHFEHFVGKTLYIEVCSIISNNVNAYPTDSNCKFPTGIQIMFKRRQAEINFIIINQKLNSRKKQAEDMSVNAKDEILPFLKKRKHT